MHPIKNASNIKSISSSESCGIIHFLLILPLYSGMSLDRIGQKPLS